MWPKQGFACHQLRLGKQQQQQHHNFILETTTYYTEEGTRYQHNKLGWVRALTVVPISHQICTIENRTYIQVAAILLLPSVIQENEVISHCSYPNIQFEIDWESSCEIFCSASMRQLGQDKAITGCFVYSCT